MSDIKVATRWRCIGLQDARGTGKAPERCPKCKGLVVSESGVYGVFTWTGTGRYPITESKGSRLTERAADKLRDRLDPGDDSLVVRFVAI